MYILHQLGWVHNQTPIVVSDMQKIAYSCSFIPCKNQRELLTPWVVFAVNIYEWFMENKTKSTSLRFPMQKKGFVMFLQWIV